MRVRVVDGHVEAQRLQQHVLVEDEVLRLLQVRVLGDVLVQARVHHLDHVLQLARLLLDLGRQEQAGRCDAVPVEMRERVEGIEPVHVHDGRVDAELRPGGGRDPSVTSSSTSCGQ